MGLSKRACPRHRGCSGPAPKCWAQSLQQSEWLLLISRHPLGGSPEKYYFKRATGLLGGN